MTTKPTESREIILKALMDILEKGEKSDRALSAALKADRPEKREDRAFITRVTEGTIERLITIDAGLDAISTVPVKDMKPLIREILRMSVYQILFMDRVPDGAAINEAVNLARAHGMGGLTGFVNGVLRKAARDASAFVFTDPVRAFSMPAWITEKWESAYGPEKTECMLKGLFNVRPVSMHVMTSRTSTEEVIKSLGEQGVRSEPNPLSDRILDLYGCDDPESLTVFKEGLIFAQDAGPSIVGEAADIQKDWLILDVCAAPGGKSMDAADRLDGTGMVISRDKSEKKTDLIRENTARTRLLNVTSQVWDATVFDESLEGKADLVIADLPCSGLGDMARKPEIRYRVSEEECQKLIALQRDILSVIWRYVKPGGKLIYSTCTVNKGENEDQREWFLSNFPFRPAPLNTGSFYLSEKETLTEGYLQLLPGIDPADGFFISVFVRE